MATIAELGNATRDDYGDLLLFNPCTAQQQKGNYREVSRLIRKIMETDVPDIALPSLPAGDPVLVSGQATDDWADGSPPSVEVGAVTVFLPRTWDGDPNVVTGATVVWATDGAGDAWAVSDYMDDKIGTMKFWNLDLGDIPAGWVLCDGFANAAGSAIDYTDWMFMGDDEAGCLIARGDTDEHQDQAQFTIAGELAHSSSCTSLGSGGGVIGPTETPWGIAKVISKEEGTDPDTPSELILGMDGDTPAIEDSEALEAEDCNVGYTFSETAASFNIAEFSVSICPAGQHTHVLIEGPHGPDGIPEAPVFDHLDVKADHIHAAPTTLASTIQFPHCHPGTEFAHGHDLDEPTHSHPGTLLDHKHKAKVHSHKVHDLGHGHGQHIHSMPAHEHVMSDPGHNHDFMISAYSEPTCHSHGEGQPDRLTIIPIERVA